MTTFKISEPPSMDEEVVSAYYYFLRHKEDFDICLARDDKKIIGIPNLDENVFVVFEFFFEKR